MSRARAASRGQSPRHASPDPGPRAILNPSCSAALGRSGAARPQPGRMPAPCGRCGSCRRRGNPDKARRVQNYRCGWSGSRAASLRVRAGPWQARQRRLRRQDRGARTKHVRLAWDRAPRPLSRIWQPALAKMPPPATLPAWFGFCAPSAVPRGPRPRTGRHKAGGRGCGAPTGASNPPWTGLAPGRALFGGSLFGLHGRGIVVDQRL
jgi:hypothetical protein